MNLFTIHRTLWSSLEIPYWVVKRRGEKRTNIISFLLVLHYQEVLNKLKLHLELKDVENEYLRIRNNRTKSEFAKVAILVND